MNLEFKEEQKFTQWWLWLLLIGIGSIPYIQFYFEFETNKPISDKDLLEFSLIYAPLLLFFAVLKLKTTIDNEGISMHYFPIYKKSVKWEEIKSAEVLKYGFVGGWGVRLWTKYGTVYNVSGNKGLAIELNNGSKFLIGTQKPDELNNFINKTKSNNE